MTGSPEDHPDPNAWTRGHRSSEHDLDELLGLDPSPRLSAAARARIHARLTEHADDALHELLGVDEVEIPAGLSARVLAAVRADRRRRRLRPVGVLFAAAAAAVLAVTGAGWWPVKSLGEGPGRSLGNGLGAPELPSEELLAALPLLESLEFLEGELDPLEQEVLLVRDPSDALILEFLELGG